MAPPRLPPGAAKVERNLTKHTMLRGVRRRTTGAGHSLHTIVRIPGIPVKVPGGLVGGLVGGAGAGAMAGTAPMSRAAPTLLGRPARRRRGSRPPSLLLPKRLQSRRRPRRSGLPLPPPRCRAHGMVAPLPARTLKVTQLLATMVMPAVEGAHASPGQTRRRSESAASLRQKSHQTGRWLHPPTVALSHPA